MNVADSGNYGDGNFGDIEEIHFSCECGNSDSEILMIDGFHESKVEGHEKTQSKASLKKSRFEV
jgi:hypothetical protein